MDINMKEYVNWKMSHDIKYGEAEGYPLVLDPCRKNKDLKNFRVYGNSVQEGEPTPENPLEIQSVGELTTKNILDMSQHTVSQGYYGDTTGNLLFSNNSVNITKITVNPSTVYTFSSNLGIYSVWFFNGTTALSRFRPPNGSKLATFTTPEDCNSIGISLSLIVTNQVGQGVSAFEWAMLELGEGDGIYEPYRKYKIPVRARGNNLFSETIYPLVVKGWINGTNGAVNGSNPDLYSYTGYISCDSFLGKAITLSPTAGVNTGIAFYNAEKIFISGKRYLDNSSCTVVVPEDAVYMRFTVPVANKDIFQLEYGNEPTPFEPYIEPQTFNIYLDEPLRKVGDYADCVDFGKDVVVRNIQENVYNGNEDWKVGTPELTNTYIFGFYSNAPEAQPVGGGKNDSLCNKFATRRSGTSSVDLEFVQMHGRYAFIRMNKSRVSSPSVDEIKNWLSGNPITVDYVLAEPIEEPIELPELPKTQAKTMIYEVGTTIEPNNMYGKYIKKY